MSPRAKRIFKKAVSRIGVLFFVLAVWMLYWQLHKYSLSEIFESITEIPARHIVWACLVCVAEYLVLSCYDFFALRYVGKKLAWWKWMLAGMLGFVVSNNAGNAAISGGAIRYRLYTRWRIKAGEIVRMLTFSGFTYYLGAATVVVVGYFLLPEGGFADSSMMRILFGGCSGFLGAYFAGCLFFRGKTFRIGGVEFKVPSVGTGLVQCVLGATDSVLAGLVLYCLTFHAVQIPVAEFVSIFVVAQSAGIFAQVPGGIGVFESVVMLAMPDSVDKAVLFGSLLAFRIVYFLLPLVGIGSLFFIYERYLKKKMKKWRIFSHIPHLPRLTHRKKHAA
ncbi:MAG: lysylphosphatidylglycerol synthase domain-containing protein [Rickettsiales bacterium]|nr:lysylphosphatidylglycerol synthase domain-containing protein [Rickettsiales bacterium]